MQVTMEIQGIEPIRQALLRLQKKGEEIEALLQEAVGRPLYNATKETFEKRRSPWGEPWKALKPSTLKAKQGRGKILYHQGRLYGSLYMRVEDSKLFVGVNAGERFQYGLTHQFGSAKVPKRPFLPIDKEGNMPDLLVRQIERNLLEWLRE